MKRSWILNAAHDEHFIRLIWYYDNDWERQKYFEYYEELSINMFMHLKLNCSFRILSNIRIFPNNCNIHNVIIHLNWELIVIRNYKTFIRFQNIFVLTNTDGLLVESYINNNIVCIGWQFCIDFCYRNNIHKWVDLCKSTF